MDIKREMQLSLRSGEDDGTPYIIWKCTGMEPALCYQQSENIKCFIAGYLAALAAESTYEVGFEHSDHSEVDSGIG